MKNILKILIIVVLIIIAISSCLHKDIPNKFQDEIYTTKEVKEYPQYINKKNITIDKVDYLQSEMPIGKYGGTLFVSTLGDPKTFNPFNNNTALQIPEMMFEGLIQTDPNTGEVIPRLAKSFKVKDNGTRIIIYLRKGIKWSDGEPITADDVVYTWKTIIFGGYENTSIKDTVTIDGELPRIRKIDNYTVEFILPKPFAPFLRNLSTSIAPKHIFKPITDKGKEAFYSYLPATSETKIEAASGPFILESYIPAQRVVLKRNPNYYMINKNGEHLPYLDKYVYLIVGDQNNELLKFEAEEIDIIGLKGSDVARYKEKEKNSNYTIYNFGPTSSTMFLTCNMNISKDTDGNFFVEPKKQKWFNDKNFRTALDYAINRESLIFNIANGVAEPLFTAESLSSIFLNKKLAKGHPQDINFAKELLKKSGFYYNKQGELYDKDNKRVEFNIHTNAGNLEREAIGVMLKQDFEDIGIKINLQPLEFNFLVNKLTNTNNWDCTIMGLTGNPLEPNSGKNVWNSNGTLHMFDMRSTETKNENLRPWEIELNEIYEKAPLTFDFEERKKYYDRYQEIVYEEKPIIYLYSPMQIVAVRNRIKNLQPNKLVGIINNPEEFYIDE